jgi:DNA polymerase III subunit beta
MKFQAELKPLLAAVKRAQGVIASRHTIPSLACVKIDATDTGLRITGTNLDEWVVARCEASVSAPGSVLIEAGRLAAWLGAAPKGALIECFPVNGCAVFQAGRTTASFNVLPVEDFPLPPPSDAETEVLGAAPALVTCAAFASVDDTRYYLNGVAINCGHAVATNGHICCAVDIGADAGIDAILPNSAVRQIAAAGPNARLFVGPNTWACEDESARLGGKLLAATYPDWQRIIPRDPVDVAQIDADALTDAVKAVVMAGDDKARTIALEGDGAEVTLRCRGQNMDASAQVSCDGAAFKIGLNSKYALTALAVFAERVVTLSGGNPTVLTCADMPGVRVAVMEMRL